MAGLQRWGDYPYSVTNFLNLVAYLSSHYWTPPDYPCEPDPPRSGAKDNRKRILRTIANAREALDCAATLPGTCVLCIQRYTLEEYRWCKTDIIVRG